MNSDWSLPSKNLRYYGNMQKYQVPKGPSALRPNCTKARMTKWPKAKVPKGSSAQKLKNPKDDRKTKKHSKTRFFSPNLSKFADFSSSPASSGSAKKAITKEDFALNKEGFKYKYNSNNWSDESTLSLNSH